MKNKFFELFVCMLVVGTCFVVNPDTVSADQDGDYFYIVSGGVATIIGYNGTGGDIEIPSTLGGYPTQHIGDSAFNSSKGQLITSVFIPSNITTIGNYSFHYCSNLTNVTIGSSVISIGSYAFEYCSKLTSAIIPDSVTTIGDYVFRYCSNLRNVTIGNNITTTGRATFAYCSNLTNVIIGSSVTTIGDYAFRYCFKLNSVTLPDNVTTIGSYAFDGCSSLTSVIIPDNVTTIGGYAFHYCKNLTNMTIPNSVSTIENFTFYQNINLTSVTIGSGVTTMGRWTFGYCTNLTSITFLGLVAPTTVGDYWIDNTPVEIRGHAYTTSNFPVPGGVWNGLIMGAPIYNNQPNITTNDTTTANEDELYSVDYNATDIDGDTLTWSLMTNASFLNIVASTGVLSGIPMNADVGGYYVNISVSDGYGGSDFSNFTLTVINVNDPPVIITVDDTIALENELYSVDYDAMDIDGDLLNWSLISNASFLNIVPSTGVLSGTPVNADVGWYYVNISVSDGYDGIDFSNFTLTVTNVTLTITTSGTGSGSVEVSPSEPYYYGTNVTIWANASTGSTFTGFTGDLTGITTPQILVMDGNKTVNAEFTLDSSGGGGGGVTPPENIKPVADVSAGEPYQGFVNSEITFDGSKSSDSDGNITKWYWVFGDNITGNGEIVRHTYIKTGTYTVTLTVTDNEGATDNDTTTCVITQPNRPPAIPIITGPTNGTKNTMYTYTAVSTDADNNTLQYTFDWGDPLSESQSSGFLPNGTVFTVNQTWTVAGRFDVTVTVSDNQTISSSKITVYIDAEQVGDIGYLLDTNGDGIFDSFYSDVSKQITAVQKYDTGYYIDSDGDGDWDYTFDAIKGLTSYQEPSKTPGLDIVLILGVIVAIILCVGIVAFVWKKKKN